jgi:hypothetical protein
MTGAICCRLHCLMKAHTRFLYASEISLFLAQYGHRSSCCFYAALFNDPVREPDPNVPFGIHTLFEEVNRAEPDENLTASARLSSSSYWSRVRLAASRRTSSENCDRTSNLSYLNGPIRLMYSQ